MDSPTKQPASAQQFTPVTVSDSPAKSTAQKGNLTGNARVIRDLVADLHNHIQAWNRYHLEGYRVLRNIADMKGPILKASEMQNREPTYPEGLQALIDELLSICGKMCDTVSEMNEVAQRMDAVVKLEKESNKNDVPLFLTWSADKFGEACQDIYSAYDSEMEVKERVTSEVSHCKSESELMLHLVAWVYQPFVVNTVESTLESLLVETGHK